MNVKERVQRMLHGSGDANIAAFGSAFIFIVVLIISVIALFLDIVYVTMIWSGLPAGFLQYVAAGGAILVSPVVILILLAKLFYFRSGGQMIFSYFAFAIDLAFAVLNTYCAFQIAWHDSNAFVIGWRDLSPITPVAILALMSILLLLDPNAKRRNKERDQHEKGRDLELKFQHEEMARGLAIRELNAEFAAAKQEAAIEVRMEALEEYKRMLKEELLNDETRAILREGARRVGDNAIHDLTGLPRKAALPTGPVVPSLPPAPIQPPTPAAPTPPSGSPPPPAPAPETTVRIAPQKAAPIPAQSVTGGTMAQPLEYCYSCGKHTNNGAWHQFRNDNRYYCRNCTPKPEPITETLAPFPVAPTEARNGNGANGHHPKPMPQ